AVRPFGTSEVNHTGSGPGAAFSVELIRACIELSIVCRIQALPDSAGDIAVKRDKPVDIDEFIHGLIAGIVDARIHCELLEGILRCGAGGGSYIFMLVHTRMVIPGHKKN